jgi:two-component system, chemotaxis family, protein-glutamate methylesterase/glutaminase
MTAPKSTTLRALLVQESSVERATLISVLQRDGDISVVGPASTATEAIRRVDQDHPDVVIIDLALRDGGSQQVIEQIMAHHPTPILVLTNGNGNRHSPSTADALIAGALDSRVTPAQWTKENEVELRHCVRQLSRVTVIRHPRGRIAKPPPPQRFRGIEKPIVAIGASTGGPAALAQLLAELGGLTAPVLVVQHLHPDFTKGLLDLIARASPLPVEIALHGQLLRPGRVYLAPGEYHLRLALGSRVELTSVPDGIHKPSADQLFRSVAEHARSAGVGVLLTGMGEDGARGLLEIKKSGGRTLAQDEASSAVFGMPRAAQLLGAVTDLLPLDQLPAAIRNAVAELRP